MFFPKSKVTSKVSKTRGGEGGQGHFWTMSKRKQLFFRITSLSLETLLELLILSIKSRISGTGIQLNFNCYSREYRPVYY